MYRWTLMALFIAIGLAFSASLPSSVALADVVWGVDGNASFRDGPQTRSYRSQSSGRSGRPYPRYMQGGSKPHISPSAPPVRSFPNAYGKGTIVVDTRGRKLYYVLSRSSAYVYPISVGRTGFQWTGRHRISRKQSWPSWTPPADMRRRQPYLPVTMSGGVNNPLGAKALYLGSTLYRIHGTNNPNTIGYATSSGCFRMMNHHVIHLASIAPVGTQVIVVKGLRGSS